MKLLVQSMLCWCLLATIASGVESAKLGLSTEMRRWLNIWLQNRSRRDLSSTSTAAVADSQFVRPEDVRDTLIPHSSTDTRARVRRSKNSGRRPGCSLGTCTVHDLAHRIHQLNNKLKVGSARWIRSALWGTEGEDGLFPSSRTSRVRRRRHCGRPDVPCAGLDVLLQRR